MSTDEDVVVPLSAEQAWELLGRAGVGRLAFHLADEVHIAPVNHVLHGSRIVFSTRAGSKLLGVEMNRDVAFEVDEVDQTHARSVVVRGVAHHLRDREAAAAEGLGLRSWVPTEKDEYVAIDVTEISGRAFRLERGPGEGDVT
ncbi:pyridoxamine 5'-phosphate oxidase family protein [Actinotalea sp. C106]|uniref:pyridoxamine 5'-phosphate oxidase family protein n=1 Tax=Actinotalea sp. C106 TaxID=2908644 RepID=UPI00202924FC|nr:pyridoxamine 5'-phosphate oxidase family protein [Actinotalea sp. C106]